VSRRSPSLAPLLAALAAAIALAAPAVAAPQTPDPFYVDLERAGQVALARGDAAEAVRKIRRACFGMLDRPERLSACLIRLGVAQSRAGDKEGFLDTFERVDGVDQRFHVYRQAPVEDAERDEFERRALEWLPPELVPDRPSFETLRWTRALDAAGAQLAQGQAAAALEQLEGIPAQVRGGEAWCLRGQAYAALGRCADAISAFTACHPELEARFAAPALDCLLDAGRLDEARRLAGALAAGVRGDRALKRPLARLDKTAPAP
jgi:tetratricopeptide (TPR) repeat protein